MTDVRRYWIDDDRKIEDAGEATQRDLLARLSRDESRAFVRVVLSDDYDALRAEVERLRQDVDEWKHVAAWKHVHDDSLEVELQRQLVASQARVRELEIGWMQWNGRRIPLPEYTAKLDQMRAALAAIAQYHSDCSLCQDMIDHARQALGKAGG